MQHTLNFRLSQTLRVACFPQESEPGVVENFFHPVFGRTGSCKGSTGSGKICDSVEKLPVEPVERPGQPRTVRQTFRSFPEAFAQAEELFPGCVSGRGKCARGADFFRYPNGPGHAVFHRLVKNPEGLYFSVSRRVEKPADKPEKTGILTKKGIRCQDSARILHSAR